MKPKFITVGTNSPVIAELKIACKLRGFNVTSNTIYDEKLAKAIVKLRPTQKFTPKRVQEEAAEKKITDKCLLVRDFTQNPSTKRSPNVGPIFETLLLATDRITEINLGFQFKTPASKDPLKITKENVRAFLLDTAPDFAATAEIVTRIAFRLDINAGLLACVIALPDQILDPNKLESDTQDGYVNWIFDKFAEIARKNFFNGNKRFYGKTLSGLGVSLGLNMFWPEKMGLLFKKFLEFTDVNPEKHKIDFRACEEFAECYKPTPAAPVDFKEHLYLRDPREKLSEALYGNNNKEQK